MTLERFQSDGEGASLCISSGRSVKPLQDPLLQEALAYLARAAATVNYENDLIRDCSEGLTTTSTQVGATSTVSRSWRSKRGFTLP